MKDFVLAILCIISVQLYGQQTIKGTVYDETGESLAFVNILLDGNAALGTTSDIDGNFELEVEQKIEFLEFRYVGYETRIYSIKENDFGEKISISLKATDLQLLEAVVIAGENPAHRIIHKTVANKKYNQPKFLDKYTCKTYNKIQFDFLPNEDSFQQYLEKNKERKNKILANRDSTTARYHAFAEQQHLMVIETITEKQYLAPNNTNETILHNQVSGFKDPKFIALTKDIQPFSFYDTHLEILDNTFLNPISKGSTKAYFFEIQDTLFQGRDSIFIISFQPKKKKTFEGLKGLLYIHTNHFALQNVIAEPADSSLTHLKIEQKYKYHKTSKKWFPEQLNFTWLMPKYPSPYVGLKIRGKSYISEINLNPDLEKKQFSADKYVLKDDANQTLDSVWIENRPEQLSVKDEATFMWWDTLSGARNLERLFNLTEALANGIYPLGKFDLDLYRVLQFNQFEDTRIGIGLHTNNRLSKRIRMGGYTGYSIRDKTWKYGGDLRLYLQKNQSIYFELGYEKDVRVPGIPQFPRSDFEPYALVDNGLYDFRMDDYTNRYAELNAQLFKNVQVCLGLSQNSWATNYFYTYLENEENPRTDFDFTELSLSIRLAPGERYVPFMGNKIAQASNLPIVQLQWIRGVDLFNQGHFEYDKLLLAIGQRFPLKRWGTMTYRIEGGWTSSTLPYAKLFSQSGLGTGFRLFDFSNTFQTMGQYEFLSDQYLSVFFEHNFGTISKKSKLIQPELVILHNFSIGKLHQPNLHKDLAFKTLEEGFFEGGLAVNNLLRFNYVNFAYLGLGWASYLRYGDNARATLQENLAHRLTINLDF